MNMLNKTIAIAFSALVVLLSSGCTLEGEQKPRLSMFIGVDISGSYIDSGHFDESLDFLARYIYAHLKGLNDLEEPNVLFVSSIGGSQPGEPKTFYPIQTFENMSVEEISARLHKIFPKEQQNSYTDPATGKNWQTKVPRRRVKIWAQDAKVMTTWNDSTLYTPEMPLEEQTRFLEWTKDNVDYGVRARRVD